MKDKLEKKGALVLNYQGTVSGDRVRYDFLQNLEDYLIQYHKQRYERGESNQLEDRFPEFLEDNSTRFLDGSSGLYEGEIRGDESLALVKIDEKIRESVVGVSDKVDEIITNLFNYTLVENVDSSYIVEKTEEIAKREEVQNELQTNMLRTAANLNQDNYLTALITSHYQREVEEVLKENNWLEAFDFIKGGSLKVDNQGNAVGFERVSREELGDYLKTIVGQFSSEKKVTLVGNDIFQKEMFEFEREGPLTKFLSPYQAGKFTERMNKRYSESLDLEIPNSAEEIELAVKGKQ